jgi:hypothetical protein
MLEDFAMMAAGFVTLAITLFFFWISLPRPSGPPRWFIGSNLEAIVSVAITSGLVLGIGFVAAGLLQLVGVR